jgi:hypothetical protein
MDEEESLPENVSGFLLESSLLSLEGFRARLSCCIARSFETIWRSKFQARVEH